MSNKGYYTDSSGSKGSTVMMGTISYVSFLNIEYMSDCEPLISFYKTTYCYMHVAVQICLQLLNAIWKVSLQKQSKIFGPKKYEIGLFSARSDRFYD